MKFKISKDNYTLCLLLFTLLLGAFFRFYNLNWDHSFFFQPDETNNIAIPAAHLEFPFKPEEFTYGSLTIYFYRAVASSVAFLTQNKIWLEASNINIIGRFISATFSTLLILLTYLLGKKLGTKTTGLLAAFFLSVNVGLIQAAHFGTTETILTLNAVLLTFALFAILKKEKYRNGYFFTGVILGLASGAKISAFIFAPFYLLAHLVSLSKKNFFKRNILFVLGLVLMVLVFLIVSPYTLLDFNAFRESFNFESGVATGKIPIFYTAQFEKTIPYFFQTIHIFPWILGWPILILGFFGLILILTLGLKKPSKEFFFLALLPTFYFLYNGSLFVKWTRYIIPLVPFFCLLAAFLLIFLYEKVRRKILLKFLAISLIIFVALWQLLYAFAFSQIYRKEDTRITASKWIYQNIPGGSNLLLEPLDVVGLPLPTNGYSASRYNQSWFDFYALDDYNNLQKKSETIRSLTTQLAKSDYIIIGSRRLWANRLRLENRYPLGAKYYRLLFNEELGFTKIKETSSYPEIFSIKINDDSAEETFQVFDHPKVMIFKNTGKFSSQNLEKILSYD